MTDEQLQHLLVYLGYDTGGVGNGYGPKTTQAVEDFRNEFGGLSEQGKAGVETQAALRKAVGEGWIRPKKTETVPNLSTGIPEWWKGIKYFQREEFRCPCGKWCNGYPVEPAYALVKLMDGLRETFGRAIIIVPPDGHSGGSGVRCEKYNASLSSSAKNSRHLLGKAADWSCAGVAAAVIEAELARRKKAGQIHYWYRISPGSYHVDVD